MTRRPLFGSVLLLTLLLLCLVGCGGDKSTKPVPNPGDTTPPASVQDLTLSSPAGRLVTLTWTAPGDDGASGRAAQYDIRYSIDPLTEETWTSATRIASPPTPKTAGQTEHFNISNLPLGAYYFAIESADEVPNWSPCSNVVTATVADLIPPSDVTNLHVSSTSLHTATLSWTAPGDDGGVGTAAQYDLRYSLEAITAETWDAATRVETPAPKRAGLEESVTVPALETGRLYYFALRAADTVPNWSAISNVANTTVQDVSAPDPVSDLFACSLPGRELSLTWTAPGNDGSQGTASEYDLRYAPFVVNDGSWDAATRIQGVPAPDSVETVESFSVPGLDPGQTYYFAIKTGDLSGNWSAISNETGMTVATPSLRRLTLSIGSGLGATFPAWSHDGQSIAFGAPVPGGSAGETSVYRTGTACAMPVKLNTESSESNGPSWSPDDSRIVYVSVGSENGEIWVMDAATGAHLVQLPTPQGRSPNHCDWSPDGTKIAFAGYMMQTPYPSEIYVVPVSGGGQPVRLTSLDEKCSDPAWSPDGTRIAYDSSLGGDFNIWTMSATGGDAVQVTTDPGYDGLPAWSPDGSRIAFMSNRSGSYQIWTIPAAGGDAAQVTFDSGNHGFPAWSRDGNQIAYTLTMYGDDGYTSDIWIVQVP